MSAFMDQSWEAASALAERLGIRKEGLVGISITVPVEGPLSLMIEYVESKEGLLGRPQVVRHFALNQKEKNAFTEAMGVPTGECYFVEITARVDDPVRLNCSFYASDKEGMEKALLMLDKGALLK